MRTTPCDPCALPCVHRLLDYLASIEGRGILTGQHTQSMAQEELHHIEAVTGKRPALLGFELLGYSPNINLEGATEACIVEVEENRGTLERAWEWARQGGILTFTWHWFSPLGGHDKSFYMEHTDYDARQALIEGTPEHAAFYSDMDHMAALLRPFAEAGVPILWRPFHECDGKWFWWGAQGMDTARELFRAMFRHFTGHHQLHNLVWVWNNPQPEGYVGDEYCDLISRDFYPPAHAHGAFEDRLTTLQEITPADKGCAIAETGVIPDGDALAAAKSTWLWYMTWSHGFCLTEEFNTFEALRALYQHPWAITLDKVPHGING